MKRGSYLSCVTCYPSSPTFKDSYKCERLIERARHRIANLSARTRSVIILSCEDIARLLQLGLRDKALLRVEQLYEDQLRLSAYAQIDGLCAALLTDFDTIAKQRDLPTELNAVVCTLIFAASRYGELLELNKIRNIFGAWWGDELVSANVNLLPGNLVNPRIKEALTINAMPDDAKKLELISEIARNHNIVLGFQRNEGFLKSQGEENKHESEEQVVEGHDLYSAMQGATDANSPYPYENMQMKMESYEELSSRTSSEGSNHSRDDEIVYLDNMKLKSPPPPYQYHSKR